MSASAGRATTYRRSLRDVGSGDLAKRKLIAAKRRRKTALVGRALFDASAKRGFIRDIADVNPRNLRVEPDRLVSFVGMEDVSEAALLLGRRTGFVVILAMAIPSLSSGRRLLVENITPCFENGKGALAQGLRIASASEPPSSMCYGPVIPPMPTISIKSHYARLPRRWRTADDGECWERRVSPELSRISEYFIVGDNARRVIGNLLASLDEEIAGLEGQVARVRQQKHGLMQKLLMGEWRLNECFEPQTAPEPALTAGGAP